MMIYETQNEIINLQEYKEIFKELLEKISNKFFNLLTYAGKERKNLEILNQNVNDILCTTEIILDYLKNNFILPEEYSDFYFIHLLIKDVLTEKDKFNQENLNLILVTLESLNQVTEYKIKLLNTINSSFDELSPKIKEKFAKRYLEFEKQLFNLKMQYYKDEPYDEEIQPFFDILKEELMG